ncbi:uncharacterized protein CMU_012920 [Cryptosporidium muris RN66]|uniref:Uncharacterized protein n=1 Tax=Cryptosporidium muris (strain RN66) TaxID=441375 RepID=B6AEK1_CRYMR|nr:uncharacterized protein CMU_012920 [Cryptosporidium muris RN66]EEA06618.1 hypothetical protein CMU_012920 [Cryptosporidium muris RN66]|eukprot:XP_002140967.1 hypothetical protein [Cryptosporidium muris RN66]
MIEHYIDVKNESINGSIQNIIEILKEMEIFKSNVEEELHIILSNNKYLETELRNSTEMCTYWKGRYESCLASLRNLNNEILVLKNNQSMKQDKVKMIKGIKCKKCGNDIADINLNTSEYKDDSYNLEVNDITKNIFYITNILANAVLIDNSTDNNISDLEDNLNSKLKEFELKNHTNEVLIDDLKHKINLRDQSIIQLQREIGLLKAPNIVKSHIPDFTININTKLDNFEIEYNEVSVQTDSDCNNYLLNNISEDMKLNILEEIENNRFKYIKTEDMVLNLESNNKESESGYKEDFSDKFNLIEKRHELSVFDKPENLESESIGMNEISFKSDELNMNKLECLVLNNKDDDCLSGLSNLLYIQYSISQDSVIDEFQKTNFVESREEELDSNIKMDNKIDLNENEEFELYGNNIKIGNDIEIRNNMKEIHNALDILVDGVNNNNKSEVILNKNDKYNRDNNTSQSIFSSFLDDFMNHISNTLEENINHPIEKEISYDNKLNKDIYSNKIIPDITSKASSALSAISSVISSAIPQINNQWDNNSLLFDNKDEHILTNNDGFSKDIDSIEFPEEYNNKLYIDSVISESNKVKCSEEDEIIKDNNHEWDFDDNWSISSSDKDKSDNNKEKNIEVCSSSKLQLISEQFRINDTNNKVLTDNNLSENDIIENQDLNNSGWDDIEFDDWNIREDNQIINLNKDINLNDVHKSEISDSYMDNIIINENMDKYDKLEVNIDKQSEILGENKLEDIKYIPNDKGSISEVFGTKVEVDLSDYNETKIIENFNIDKYEEMSVDSKSDFIRGHNLSINQDISEINSNNELTKDENFTIDSLGLFLDKNEGINTENNDLSLKQDIEKLVINVEDLEDNTKYKSRVNIYNNMEYIDIAEPILIMDNPEYSNNISSSKQKTCDISLNYNVMDNLNNKEKKDLSFLISKEMKYEELSETRDNLNSFDKIGSDICNGTEISHSVLDSSVKNVINDIENKNKEPLLFNQKEDSNKVELQYELTRSLDINNKDHQEKDVNIITTNINKDSEEKDVNIITANNDNIDFENNVSVFKNNLTNSLNSSESILNCSNKKNEDDILDTWGHSNWNNEPLNILDKNRIDLLEQDIEIFKTHEIDHYKINDLSNNLDSESIKLSEYQNQKEHELDKKTQFENITYEGNYIHQIDNIENHIEVDKLSNNNLNILPDQYSNKDFENKNNKEYNILKNNRAHFNSLTDECKNKDLLSLNNSENSQDDHLNNLHNYSDSDVFESEIERGRKQEYSREDIIDIPKFNKEVSEKQNELIHEDDISELLSHNKEEYNNIIDHDYGFSPIHIQDFKRIDEAHSEISNMLDFGDSVWGCNNFDSESDKESQHSEKVDLSVSEYQSNIEGDRKLKNDHFKGDVCASKIGIQDQGTTTLYNQQLITNQISWDSWSSDVNEDDNQSNSECLANTRSFGKQSDININSLEYNQQSGLKVSPSSLRLSINQTSYVECGKLNSHIHNKQSENQEILDWDLDKWSDNNSSNGKNTENEVEDRNLTYSSKEVKEISWDDDCWIDESSLDSDCMKDCVEYQGTLRTNVNTSN